jgi:hypothetical protein
LQQGRAVIMLCMSRSSKLVLLYIYPGLSSGTHQTENVQFADNNI